MKNEIMILGATGRTARRIAADLSASGVPLVLAGRTEDTLTSMAAELGGSTRLVVGSLESVLAGLSDNAPGVVISTVGPFMTTAPQVVAALPSGTHYVDISNEFPSLELVLELHQQAVDRGQTLVTAAGFGVVATETAVMGVCAGRAAPHTLRVDLIASVAIEAGTMGAAFAGTVMEAATYGSREVRGGKLVKTRTGARYETITTPDGDTAGTGGAATGDLMSAGPASKADNVVAASTFVPSNPAARAMLPVVGAVVKIPGVAGFMTARMAGVKLRAAPRPRAHSWGYARAEWASGEKHEAWLRVDDGTDFTATSTAEVARRLLAGTVAPGAYTPGELFGVELAESLGAVLTVI